MSKKSKIFKNLENSKNFQSNSIKNQKICLKEFIPDKVQHQKNNKIDIPKETLNSLYWNKQLSLSEIAKIYDCNPETIRRRMIEHKLKRRRLHQRKYNISKNELDKLYNKKKLSTIEIAKKYGCSQWVIWSLINNYGFKTRDANDYHKWKNVSNLIRPVIKPSHTLSYVLGVILGDGWVYKYKHFYSICLESIDKVFCESFMRELQKLKLNPFMINNKERVWRVIASSRVFYDWYKSLKLRDIKNIALKYPSDFIRGFYESEGSISINKDKKYGYRRPAITIVNTKKELIILVKNLLEILDFHPSMHKRNARLPHWKPIWALNIAKQKEVPIFFEKIRPCIKKMKN